MKITKSQLKQIIKEELSSITEGGAMGHYEGPSAAQAVIEQVKQVVTLFSDLYNGLPDNESKELFEDYLNKNVELYTETWREERAEGPEEAPSDIEDPTVPSPEEENFRTVEFMINFYQDKPWAWESAEYAYQEMAEGGDPDGIRSEMYPDWSDEDFAEVIRTIDPRGEY